jgi:hypothetical protein
MEVWTEARNVLALMFARVFAGTRSRWTISRLTLIAELEGIAQEIPHLNKPFRKAELATIISQLVPAAVDALRDQGLFPRRPTQSNGWLPVVS